MQLLELQEKKTFQAVNLVALTVSLQALLAFADHSLHILSKPIQRRSFAFLVIWRKFLQVLLSNQRFG